MSRKHRLSFIILVLLSVAVSLWAQPGRRGAARPGGRMGGGSRAVFDSPVQAKDDWEKTVLAVLDDMDRTQRRGNMNVPVEDGRLLRLFAESIQAKHIVEIGTSTGYSGVWMCLALKKTGGKLTTYEIDANRADTARANFKRAGVEDLITLVLGNAHEEVQKLTGPIDLLFLDADKEGYIDYLQKLLPKVRAGGLIMAHNMNPGQADPEFVEAITKNKDLETLFLHMDASGMSVTLKKH